VTACGTLSYILTYDEVLAFSVLKTVGTVRYHVARKICIHQSFSALTLWLGGEHPGIPACKKLASTPLIINRATGHTRFTWNMAIKTMCVCMHHDVLSTTSVPFRSFFMSMTRGAVGPELSFPSPSPSFHPIFCSISLPICTADCVVWHSVADDVVADTVTVDVDDDSSDADDFGAVSDNEVASACCYK